jgi:hypothetical protein
MVVTEQDGRMDKHTNIAQGRVRTELQTGFSPLLRERQALLPGKPREASWRKWFLKQMVCCEGISGYEDCKNKGSLGKREGFLEERRGNPIPLAPKDSI